MLKIIDKTIPESNPNRPGGVYDKQYITIHETGNTSPTANAASHAEWMLSGSNGEVGYHYTVDDHEAYHHIPDNERAWHAGDGDEGAGNLHSIGIEMCVNEGSDIGATRRNAAVLTAKLMHEYHIPFANVVQHHHWSGKDCPKIMRATPGAWDAFLALVKELYDVSNPTPSTPPKAPPNEVAQYQAWINATYGESLAIDGSFGPLTKRASIKALQAALNAAYGAGLAVDGSFGPLTKAATRRHNLRRGSKGALVRILQGALYGKGYDPKGFDGSFGPGCDAAVRMAQARACIKVDGYVGPDTWTVLIK